ncbi:MAG: tRNA pseudouridine(38-40) synthase TruA [Bacteroidota bacterium]
MRYFVELSYNGTSYHGWQIQPNAITVQEILNKSFSLLLKTNIELVGCGRTDTGVHARQYYAHFDIETNIEVVELKRKINNMLPNDIYIIDFIEVNNDLHARFSAISRSYSYYIDTVKNPFSNEFAWHCEYPLNLELMNNACKILLSKEDFACFSKSNTDNHTTLCNVTRAEWTVNGSQYVFNISANRFLRNMVRAIVGTIIDVGRGRISLGDFDLIIESKNRQKAGFSVPAKGLFLEKIIYPELN